MSTEQEKIEALEASLEGAQIVAGQLMQVARRAARVVREFDQDSVDRGMRMNSLRRALERAGYLETYPKEREGA